VLLKINKYVKQVHLVGFTIGIYYDARTYERQILNVYCRTSVRSHSSVVRRNQCLTNVRRRDNVPSRLMIE